MTMSVVIVDDHPIVVKGLERLFALEKDIKVVATCASGDEALKAVTEHQPDVVVLDLRMPGKDGLTVIREMKRAKLSTRVVILTASLEESALLEALRLGVRGILLKELAPELVVTCVRKVHAGEQWVEGGMMVRAMERISQREQGLRETSRLLTAREQEVVRMVATGLRNKAIADKLHISEGTVKIHLHNIYEKLEVDGRLALILYALDKGLV